MLTEGDAGATELRKRVTSPGGTTQAAIEAFEDGGFRELVDRAIAAATARGRELSAGND
jgi:pyrroline-5-carboxylate reductase